MKARLLVSIAGLALLAALAWVLLGRDDSLERLRRAGVIRIGYAVEPPYAFVREDGSVTGEAPELARHIAARLEIPRVEWRQMEFDELIDALLAGRIDVIAAGMFITPERQHRVLFSVPTLRVRPALLVAKGNPGGITSYRQAAAVAGLRIAVLAGAVEGEILRRLGVTEDRLLVVPDALTGRQAVQTGLASALMLSEPTLRWMSRGEQPGPAAMLLLPGPNRDEDSYGHPAFAFRPDARQLQAAWDRALILHLNSPEHRAQLVRLGLGDLAAAGHSP